jgi:hypothetical protein
MNADSITLPGMKAIRKLSTSPKQDLREIHNRRVQSLWWLAPGWMTGVKFMIIAKTIYLPSHP